MANTEWIRLYSTIPDVNLVIGIRKSQIIYFSLKVWDGKLTFEVDTSLVCYAGGEGSNGCLSYSEPHWDLTEAIEFVKEATSDSVKAPISRPAQTESIVADLTQKPKDYKTIVLESLEDNSYVAQLLRKRNK